MHSVVVGGGETQQELIPFKHKEWSVVDLVLSELTVTEMGACIRRHGARKLTATKTARRTRLSEIVAYTLKKKCVQTFRTIQYVYTRHVRNIIIRVYIYRYNYICWEKVSA